VQLLKTMGRRARLVMAGSAAPGQSSYCTRPAGSLRRTARLALPIALVLAAFPARAVTLDAQDVMRLGEITDAIQTFEDEVVSALHHLPADAEQIESYSYVKLNLEAAHERLNNLFAQVAVSIYVESPGDEALILNLVSSQLLPASKNYLNEKKDAIASLAAAHPANPVFAAYATRANALLGDRAIPQLDELARKIAAGQR
jgi:hypothetical protein